MALTGNQNHYTSFIFLLVSTWCLLASFTWANHDDWLNHGGDIYNRRYAKDEEKISPKTVYKLKLKWKFYTGKDTTATPAIYDGTCYFPSWNGHIYAVDAKDGGLKWKKNLTELTGLGPTGYVTGVNYVVSRATPTVAGDLLIISIYGPAIVIAVKRHTGNLVWKTQLDQQISSVVTMSGTVYNGGYYVGTSSLEELLGVGQCCTFRGSMCKLDVHTGKILWQTYVLPDNYGKLTEYSGAAMWGSSPSIDHKRKHVYVATGNLYTAPQRILDCQEEENNKPFPASPDKCIEPENHENSIMAFDLDHGDIKWYKQLGGYDVWFFQCNDLSSNPGCPPGPNPDADFGEAPMMLTIYQNDHERERDIVVAVQKSGIAWALDRNDGNIVWSTQAGPGGYAGGGTWGSATDEKRVYTNIVNNLQVKTTLVPSKYNTTAGQWVAMNAYTGKVLWSIANPKNSTSSGPVTVANDVLFVGSDDPQGAIYALDAKTGYILWSYNTGATVHGGMSVSDGCIYVGHGYTVNIGAYTPFYTPGTYLYAFCIHDD